MRLATFITAPRRIAGGLLLRLLHLYRIAISPALGPACRYVPTCSAYAEQAIRGHGPWRGTWLAIRRIVRCHPFAKGGLDPVPGRD